jgi:hypothetical protein
MATPIRNTPELKGEHARRFQTQISVIPSREERIKERERIARNVARLLELTRIKSSYLTPVK